MKKSGTNQSLDRAMDLLEMLSSPAGNAMNIAEVGKALGISWVTAQALVNSLSHRNYIEKVPESNKYRIGCSLFGMGNQYPLQYPFLFACEKHVLALADKWDVKINVTILKPVFCSVVIMSKDASLIPNMVMGRLMPAYATASGRLLLTGLTRQTFSEWAKDYEFKQYTPNTYTHPKRLWESVEKARADGYVMEVEELAMHRACIAAPIYGASGELTAAISFSGEKVFIIDNQEILLSDICAAAGHISLDLGYHG